MAANKQNAPAAEITPPEATTVTVETQSATDNETDAFIAPYRKAYPKEKQFHITSDKQVFLGKDLHYAKMHQKQADANKQVTTIEF
jgi:hypothetical protein